MRVGVVGINHKMANLKLRDMIARVTDKRFGAGKSIHHNHDLVLLSTCNRTEVYFASDNLSESQSELLNILRADLGDHEEDFDQKLYTYFGEDCFSHLARVTTGLDSAIVAETEIQGQVKGAYELASSYTTLPPELHFMFQKVLRIGKQVRAQLLLDRGMPNLQHALHHAAHSFFKKSQKAKILFVGASEINCQALAFLKKKGWENISLCNRTSERAAGVIEHHMIPYVDWSQLDTWHTYDWIIFGTKATEPLITEAPVLNKKTLVVDLCVPRNVAPHLARTANLSLLNIDQLNRTLTIRRKRMHHLLEEAEQLVTCLTQRHFHNFKTKSYRPLLLQEAI